MHGQVRQNLISYVVELLEWTELDCTHTGLARRVAQSTLLDCLPDCADRRLLGDAIQVGCDAFVTADVRTIVSKRHRLPALPLRILTPTEWWATIRPWGGLWL